MTMMDYFSIAALLWAIAGVIITMKPWDLD